MKHLSLLVVASGIGAALLCGPARADVITTYTNAGLFPANDSLDWGQLGNPFTSIASPVTATSVSGLTVTVTQPGGGDFERRDEGSGWIGIYTAGTHLLWNQDHTNEMDFAFSSPISGFGTAAQADFFGPYNATLQIFDGATLLGTLTVSGDNTGAEDGSAPFAGITDSVADITNVVITTDNGGFTVDSLALQDTPTNVPEPASLALFGTALAGLGFLRRKRAV